MKFEFAKYTEVTELAFKVNPEYQANSYERIFLCCDTKVFWIARILKGYGEDYEEIEGSYIVERDRKDKWAKTEKLNRPKAEKLLINDELENWDYEVYDCLEDAIESLDGGFGINDLSEVAA